MKPVIYNDVLAAVSAISDLPPQRRRSAIARLLDEAERADAYRVTHRAAHPVFGDGSLMAAALRLERRGDASFQTRNGLHAWLCVLNALSERLDQPEAQLMQRVAVGSSSSRLTAISSPQSSQ